MAPLKKRSNSERRTLTSPLALPHALHSAGPEPCSPHHQGNLLSRSLATLAILDRSARLSLQAIHDFAAQSRLSCRLLLAKAMESQKPHRPLVVTRKGRNKVKQRRRRLITTDRCGPEKLCAPDRQGSYRQRSMCKLERRSKVAPRGFASETLTRTGGNATTEFAHVASRLINKMLRSAAIRFFSPGSCRRRGCEVGFALCAKSSTII